jgi:polysaccharide export outer membrane protein
MTSLITSRRYLCGALLAVVAVAGASPAPAQRVAAGADVLVARPGDVLRLRVWREPEYTCDSCRVSADGTVVLPRIGSLRVTDMPTDSLQRFLINRYSTYLRDPAIEVTLLPRVTVSGAVREPGAFNVEPTMTVAEVLALAKGRTSEGRRDRIVLVRDGQRLETQLSPGARIGNSPIRSGDQLVVPERSWISRNVPLVVSMVSTVGWVILSLSNR